MDSLQEWAGLYLDIKRASNFLSKYRTHYEKHTKFIELQIAWFFVLVLCRNNKEEYLIGFPTLYHLVKDRRLTLSEAIERKIVLDEDFDIVVAPKKEAQQVNHRIQIVRFTGDVEGNTENLFNFLKEKKFNIPKDEKLLLLVWLEKGLRLNYLELGQKLDKTNVPYGQIFILGQRKPAYSQVFFCCEVFPDVKKLRDLDFSFLKSVKEAKA